MNPQQPFGPEFILGGVLEIAEESFRFEIWSKRELTDEEIYSTYAQWRTQFPNERRKGRTVQLRSEKGWKR